MDIIIKISSKLEYIISISILEYIISSILEYIIIKKLKYSKSVHLWI